MNPYVVELGADEKPLLPYRMSICGPMVLTPLITFIKPANFDWEVFKQIKSDVGTLEELQSQTRQQQQQHDYGDHDEITTATTPQVVVVAKNGAEKKADDNDNEEEEENERRHDEEVNARLLVARKKAAICCVALCLCLCILWPIPMYGSNYGECVAVALIYQSSISLFHPTSHTPFDSLCLSFISPFFKAPSMLYSQPPTQ